MNFLAHAYLSFDQKEVLVGNMISDFVKGSAQYSFPQSIQKGIRLHRMIDQFTDTHTATQRAKEVFRPHYRLYSAPILDIIYDHFLASDVLIFPQDSLHHFTQSVYETLEEYSAYLPVRFAQVFLYMRMQNWLFHYRTPEGIERSLNGLIRRSTFLTDSRTAFALFVQHYDLLQQCYRDFFADVMLFAKQQLAMLNRY